MLHNVFNYFFYLGPHWIYLLQRGISGLCCTVFYMPLVFVLFYFVSRLLKKEENFIFIPRSREELPENFPKEIPGICYFLEVRSGQKPPKSSVTSARVRKVSYNIGTMFLRETSL